LVRRCEIIEVAKKVQPNVLSLREIVLSSVDSAFVTRMIVRGAVRAGLFSS